MNKKVHWKNVFSTKTEKEVSWYQEYPQTSVDFLTASHLPLDAKIIDIGGGDSRFIDALLDLGYTDLTLLDISSKAIERVQKRLGTKAGKVKFIVSDVLDFEPTVQYDFWHDRACFHFLTQHGHVEQYADIVEKSIAEKGIIIIGTFSENGPNKCSGLEIKQYSGEKLRLILEKAFHLTGCFTEEHITPFDTVQDFLFCTFKRKES